jgi:hypothetical protein
MQCSAPLIAHLSATVLVAGLGAAACSGGPPAQFATPSTLPPQSTATNPPVTAVDPASFPETQAGATAFVNAFFDAYRNALASGQTKTARSFIEPGCGCFPVLSDLDAYAARGARYSGVNVEFGGLDVQLGRDQASALYYTSSTAGSVVAANGSPMASVDADARGALTMELSWRGRWWITDVRPA